MKWVIRVVVPVFLIFTITLLIISSNVVAQEEPPEQYQGLTNPFTWNDSEVQAAGSQIYSQKCQGCHGINGSNLPNADFSTEEYSTDLERNPDYYFWILSDGVLNIGMPGYSSSLSENERWQVITYTWSLKSALPLVTEELPVVENGLLRLHIPDEGTAGEPVTIGVGLYQNQGEPVPNALVEFFIQADFFASGLMEIGEAMTQNNGQAEFSYVPRIPGETTVVARYGNIEARKTMTFAPSSETFYHPEVGIHIPAIGEEVLIGPPERLNLGVAGEAPPPVLRLPTGHLAWLAPLLFAAMCIWIVYSFVVYQLVRIPEWTDAEEIDTRKFPRWLLVIVSILGFLLMVMLILGPESNPHLL